MNTFSVTQGGSRLIVTIPVIPGLTAGDVYVHANGTINIKL